MGSLNKICLIGRLGKDPELRYTQAGKAVCVFSLATDETYNGEKKTEWHQVSVWGGAAEPAAKFLSKGSQVYVEGKLQSREYDDKQGIKRRVWEVNAFQCVFLGTKSEGEGVAARPASNDNPFDNAGPDSYIPF